MQEDFVQLIWEQKRFHPHKMRTTDGRAVAVIRTGTRNFGTGPDFQNGELIIGNQRWAGTIEIHVDGKDWYRHKHDRDVHYNSVVAHIVWQETGKDVVRQDGTVIPEIVISECVDEAILGGFRVLVENDKGLPCQNLISGIDRFYVTTAFESYGMERMILKSEKVLQWVDQCVRDWERAFWIVLAAAWGGNQNREAFEWIATHLPLKVLWKTENVQEKEALLLGAAGLLGASTDDPYVQNLSRQWAFLKHKNQLQALPEGSLKFGGLRPAQYPSIRLAQLAALLQLNPRLDVLLGPVEKLFAVLNELIPSNYWETHYVLGKPSKPVNKKLGKQFVHNLLINAVAPIRWTYYHTILNKPLETDVAEMLSALPAEKNRFTRIFESAGIKPRNALETQAVLHLFRNYCSEKRCMQCQIGVKILRSS